MIRSLVVAGLLAWFGGLLLWRYFGSVHREQNDRERRLDRREASLNVWSAELEQVDPDGVLRARAAADQLLNRALGPAPLQLIDEAAE